MVGFRVRIVPRPGLYSPWNRRRNDSSMEKNHRGSCDHRGLKAGVYLFLDPGDKFLRRNVHLGVFHDISLYCLHGTSLGLQFHKPGRNPLWIYGSGFLYGLVESHLNRFLIHRLSLFIQFWRCA